MTVSEPIIDKLSYVPLYVEAFFNETKIAFGTSFVVSHNEKFFLITNRHVATGRRTPEDTPISPTAAIPNILNVFFHIAGPKFEWYVYRLNLFENDNPVYKEHPLGKEVDIVAIPLRIEDIKNTKIAPLDLTLAETKMYIAPSEPVSIIGFPEGLKSFGNFPIWKTGHIASDIDLDYNKLPVFLIDATTRKGMSGAPVIAKRVGIHAIDENTMTSRSGLRFLGVYSGRIPSITEESNIGIVWKPKVISEILT